MAKSGCNRCDWRRDYFRLYGSNRVRRKKMSITIVPSSNAVVLGDNTTNPMTSNVGAFVLGWDGSDWDRVKVANGGRLQVDVLTSPALVLSEPVSVDENGGSLTVD